MTSDEGETASARAEAANASGGLEEVVVTARKQKESLLNVPVAAATVSSADLARYSIREVEDLGSQIPSVNLDKTPLGGVGSLTIRGIGSSTYDAGIEQAVATVVDGVQTSRGAFLNSGLLDLAQAEILKGPQALFFGKNSPGGVVSLDSNGPTDRLSGYLHGGYEFKAQERVYEGAISGPLTDELRGRLAFRANEMVGWLANNATTTANPFAVIPGYSTTIAAPPYTFNGVKGLAGRATIDYKPTAEFTATLRVVADSRIDNGPAADTEITRCPQPPSVVILGVADPSNDCNLNWRNAVGPVQPPVAASDRIFANGPEYGHYQSHLPSLTLEYSHGPVDVTSVSGYMGYRYTRVLVTPSSYGFAALGEDERFTQFSQEVRAVTKFDMPVNFSLGAYYEKSNLELHYPNGLVPALADPLTGSYLTYILDSHNTGKTYSAFGQARWKILEQLELAAGLRYSRDEQSGNVGNSFLNSNSPIPLSTQGVFYSGERTYTNASPEVTLSWKPQADTLLYGSFKTGYKSGGASTLAIIPVTFDGNGLFYEPEKIRGFEIGLKTLQLEDHLRITAAAYTYKYTNLQVSNFNAATFAIQALNAGGLRTSGGELSIDYKPADSLTLSASLGNVHARYTAFSGVACYSGQDAATGCGADGTEDLGGQPKFRSPEWTGNLSVLYEIPTVSNYLIGLSGAMRFSSSYFAEENNSPFAIQGDYRIYDASVHLRAPDDSWQVALIGRNIGNKEYLIASLDAPDAAPGTVESAVNRPRQIILDLRYRFQAKE